MVHGQAYAGRRVGMCRGPKRKEERNKWNAGGPCGFMP